MGKKRKSKAEASQIPVEYEQPARKIIQGLQQGSRQSWERAEAQKPREDMVSGGQNCFSGAGFSLELQCKHEFHLQMCKRH